MVNNASVFSDMIPRRGGGFLFRGNIASFCPGIYLWVMVTR